MKIKHPTPSLGDWWRIPRVIWHLLKRPGDLARYSTQSLQSKSTPLDLGIPWWSFGAVDAVASFLRPDMEVFEFGSGGSSIFLARRSKRVTCVEDSRMWANLVREEAHRRGINNLEIVEKPFEFQKSENFSESAYLQALGDRAYHMVVVDGQEDSSQVRPECFRRAESRVREGGLIVLDDSWRYPQLKSQSRAKRWKDYKGVGCCRRGVTSTCLFFY